MVYTVAVLAFLPLPLMVVGQEAKCAYVMVVMSCMWLTEAVPIAVTALVPVFMFPMTGVLKAKDVGESYVNVRMDGKEVNVKPNCQGAKVNK
ncbi:solute carrier family 13 member 2 [Elysia marginata]|uniref:Solute carrier family 13 member 2 n=1 Tax=Elysia marginata TaxID=1093978 RepID=A0AAV4IRA8_9GAST|nr:solute carrier family 13 member 2 [Elysia marginata]